MTFGQQHCWNEFGEGRGGKSKCFGFLLLLLLPPQVCRAWEKGRAEQLGVRERGMGHHCCCLSTPLLQCWLALLFGSCLSTELIKCRSTLHSFGWTDSLCWTDFSHSCVLQIGIVDFMCVFSGKGKLTSWQNPKEWGGWQSLYMCWGLIWL